MLDDLGWIRSAEQNEPVDRDGNPIPWITYPALSFLSDRVKPWMRVFEYGAGSSTLWWAERVAQVVSVEHNREWFQMIQRRAPQNARVCWRRLDDDYCRGAEFAVEEWGGPFNIVVIDGRRRGESARSAVNAISDDGVLIWDNSDRGKYRHGLEELARAGWRRIDFDGLSPLKNEVDRTSILYRDGNCFGL